MPARLLRAPGPGGPGQRRPAPPGAALPAQGTVPSVPMAWEGLGAPGAVEVHPAPPIFGCSPWLCKGRAEPLTGGTSPAAFCCGCRG